MKTVIRAVVVLGLLLSSPARADVRGDFRLAIIRVEYPDTTPRYTETQLKAAAAEMADYFSELSYRNLRIVPTVALVGTFGRPSTFYWSLCDPAKPEKGLCATAGFPHDIAQIAALGGGGIDFTKIDGIMIVSSFCNGDVTIGPVGIDRPNVKGTFQVAYDFECPPRAPLTATGPSGVYWGSWAHELGHMLQFFEGIKLGGKWNGHPSSYNSGYVLLDSCYPTGPDAYSVLGPTFMKGAKKVFNGWLPDSKVSVVNAPASGTFTTTIRLRATSLSPYTSFDSQVIKLPITDGYYYLVESRLRVGIDRLPTTLSAGGLWDEGVRISLVDESSDPPVRNVNACSSTVPGGCVETKLDPRYGSCFSSPTPGYCWPFLLFHPGDKFRDVIKGIEITVGAPTSDGFFVTIDRTPGIRFADLTVAERPPLPPFVGFSASALADRQVWIDNPCNGFEVDVGPVGLRYGPSSAPGLVAGDDLCLGEENRLYARIENRGTAPAQDVRVHFDLGEASVADLGCLPQQQPCAGGWIEVGTADARDFPALASLAPGQSATVWVSVLIEPPIPAPPQGPAPDASRCFVSPAMRVRIDPAEGEVSTGDNLAGFSVQHKQALTMGGVAHLEAPFQFTSPFADEQRFMVAVISQLPTGGAAGFGQFPEIFQLAGQGSATLPLAIDLPANPPPPGSRYLIGATVGTMIPIENELVPDQPDQGHGHADFHVVAATTVVLDVVAPAELQLTAGFKRQSPGEVEVGGDIVPNHPNTWITLRYTDGQRLAATKRVRTENDGSFREQLQAAPGTTVSALWAGDLDHAPAAAGPVVPAPTDAEFTFNDCMIPLGTMLFHGTDMGPTQDPDPQRGYIGDDGTGTNCVVHLTDANFGSSYGVFSIPAPAGGSNADSIHMHWRSLVGGDNGSVCTATQFGRTGADGYSMSWGTDLPNVASYGNPGEEGAGSGLIVTVDTFDNGNGEAPGLEIKWRGARVAFDRINADPGLAKDFLRQGVFVEADLSVDPAGRATFTYDGRVLTATLGEWVGPGGGCIMFGARTGGACDNHWIDDVVIEKLGSSQPELTARVVNGQLQILFPTVSGRTYTIESTDSLRAQGFWSPAPGNSTVPGTGAVLNYNFGPMAGPGKFFRVRANP